MTDELEPRIIGGMFGLTEMLNLNNPTPPFLRGHTILLTNARSGIALLIELLSPPQVWLPSYLCDSMLKVVNQAVITLKFYGVSLDLTVHSWSWLNEVKPNDLVVFIDYFGFPLNPAYVTRVKEQNAWVLEDASQALLSEEVGRFADFILFSPHKFLGIPDGGILTFNHKLAFNSIELKSPPPVWWLKAFSATIRRREFDLYGGDRSWFDLFQEINTESPIGLYSMSEFSQMLLEHSFDYVMIAQRRIENYQLLANLLENLALFPMLPPLVVPLGFPIRLKNRDRVRQKLFAYQIYPPVHWPIHGIVPEEFRDSHQLAAEIMTLPCDQRYNYRDMQWMAQRVREVLEC